MEPTPVRLLPCGHCNTLPIPGTFYGCCPDCGVQPYCSMECRINNKSEHQAKCKWYQLNDLMSVLETVEYASEWRNVLPLQSKMENLLMKGDIYLPDIAIEREVICLFIRMNDFAISETDHDEYKVSNLRLRKYLVQHLGNVERFHDQGVVLGTM